MLRQNLVHVLTAVHAFGKCNGIECAHQIGRRKAAQFFCVGAHGLHRKGVAGLLCRARLVDSLQVLFVQHLDGFANVIARVCTFPGGKIRHGGLPTASGCGNFHLADTNQAQVRYEVFPVHSRTVSVFRLDCKWFSAQAFL